MNPRFTCPYPYKDNPTCAGTGILYTTATDLNSLFGFPPNPATITNFSSANLPLTGTTGVTGYPSHPKTIVNYRYSLEWDYELPYKLMANLGYQGSQMRHLLIQNNWNVIGAYKGYAMNPAVNFLDFYENSGNGNYNAMVATLTHNFANNFMTQVQYTWAKAMDENSGPYYMDVYPYNTHAAYGRSNYNVQDALKLYGLWQPAFFRGNSMLEKVLGGWSLGGIWNWHTGFPWNPIYNTVSNIYYQGSRYGQLRPTNHLGGAGTATSNSTFQGFGKVNPNYSGDGTQYFPGPTYVIGATFPATSPAPVPGIHRNSLNGPHYNDVDASLTKSFGLPRMPVLGENATFSFRADAYNLFNKLNINPSSINGTLGSVNPNGTTVPESAFGVAGSGLGSRTVQLQARFNF